MAKYRVKIEKVIEAELPNEATAIFREFLIETVRDNPNALLIDVDRVPSLVGKPNLPQGNAGY